MTSPAPSDTRILEFEAAHQRAWAGKDERIRTELGISPARYYQRLNMIIDVPHANETYPVMMSRLRRLRDRRASEQKS